MTNIKAGTSVLCVRKGKTATRGRKVANEVREVGRGQIIEHFLDQSNEQILC